MFSEPNSPAAARGAGWAVERQDSVAALQKTEVTGRRGQQQGLRRDGLEGSRTCS